MQFQKREQVNEFGFLKEEESAAQATVAEVADGEIPVEVRLAIVAAIAAYYEGEKSKCEFKVKRIKRL